MRTSRFTESRSPSRFEPAATFRGGDVVGILDAARSERNLPHRIQVNNGTGFTSKALDHWACRPLSRLTDLRAERNKGMFPSGP